MAIDPFLDHVEPHQLDTTDQWDHALKMIAKGGRWIFNDAQLGSKFCRANVHSGIVGKPAEHDSKMLCLSVRLATPLVTACQKRQMQTRWSMNARKSGVDVSFDIPMNNKEEALGSYYAGIRTSAQAASTKLLRVVSRLVYNVFLKREAGDIVEESSDDVGGSTR